MSQPLRLLKPIDGHHPQPAGRVLRGNIRGRSAFVHDDAGRMWRLPSSDVEEVPSLMSAGSILPPSSASREVSSAPLWVQEIEADSARLLLPDEPRGLPGWVVAVIVGAVVALLVMGVVA